MMKTSFLYFAYGSNLLTERIRINNPSAMRRAIAKLQGYRLDFTLFAGAWHGAVATIVPDPLNCVWGVIWALDESDRHSLDRQETGYDPISVNVETAGGEWFECRSYLLANTIGESLKPSSVYKNVIIKGAVENGLPKNYIEWLHQIEDNGYNGPVEVKLSFRG